MATPAERILDYLIIGGGLAGATAAEAIRKLDQQGTILIVTQEDHYPYHRPPLSKEYVRGEIEADGTYGNGGVYVQTPLWYSSQQIELLRDVTATELDTRAKQVRMDDGQVLHYVTLLLATGAHPRMLDIPGADLPGIAVLRTLDQADTIREVIAPGQQIAFVGSGFIGMEVAASALTKGAGVTIIEPRPRAWEALMTPELSGFFQGQFAAHGATLRYGCMPQRFNAAADGRVGSVTIVNAQGQPEDIPCNAVVVGIGVQLNTELAQSAGLAVDPRHGIVVDERLETQVAGVFVAGDVAAFPDLRGERFHFEHWDNAIATGQVAGANMAGGDEPFRHVPYFFSDQFDLSLNMLGFPAADAQVVIRGDTGAKQFTAFYVRGGKLAAALMVNDDGAMDQLTTLIADAVAVPDPTRLADPTFDLTSLQA